MNLLSALQPWQWLLLALVPPAILALYFLKLRRQPVEIPSTYLWARTLEDLHVNSLWQQLRQSLLLLLQLLLVGLVILALLRPGWRGTRLQGERFIFLIDASASMSATDVEPNRLEGAKSEAIKLVNRMPSGQAAMVISFSNVARVEQSFTDNKPALRQAIQQIGPTQRSSNLNEALVAAAGLANPGRSSEAGGPEVQVADALPATLYILSDGGFADVPDFALGNLSPQYVPLGAAAPRNVGIVAFSAERNTERPGLTEAFGRVQNSGLEPVDAEAELYLDDRLLDAARVQIPPGEAAAVQFEFPDVEAGTLRLVLPQPDHFAVDNQAFATINAPRPARVLVVTPRNDTLATVMRTEEAVKVANVAFATPEVLNQPDYQAQSDAGRYDLIVYDQCAPPRMPQANTWFLGRLPPLPAWGASDREGPLLITDTRRDHPLMELIEMGDVRFVEGFSLRPPPGSLALMDIPSGPFLAIAPRQGFEDLVLAAEIMQLNEKGEQEVNTDWPIRRSFPVFILNVLRYLGGDRQVGASPSIQPGTPLVLRARSPVEELRVQPPSQREARLRREGENTYTYSDTGAIGIYEVREGSARDVSQRFAVNLFDPRESDLSVRSAIELGHEPVAGTARRETARVELWKWLVLAGLGVLVFEWYVYNRRVYL